MTRPISEILAPPCDHTGPNIADTFFPEPPKTLEQTGLNKTFVEDLICKILLSAGSMTGLELARRLGLGLQIFSDLLHDLKLGLILAYQATSGINDFHYILTEAGKQKALLAREQSGYLGTAAVPFQDYLLSIEKQSISSEQPSLQQLQIAFEGLVLSDDFLDLLGPAVNSGRGLFLYGAAGNGKTEVAIRIAKCFSQSVYIPKTIIVEGQIIQLYDPQCHKAIAAADTAGQQKYDQRWVAIERPAVVVGGDNEEQIGVQEQVLLQTDT